MRKEQDFKLPEENSMQHHARAIREAKRNGGIKSVKRTKDSKVLNINYKNGTGYWLGN